MNLQKCMEFTWEGKRKDEKLHFLSPPPPALDFNDCYPNAQKLKKMKRLPKEKAFNICEVVFKKDPKYGFLSGIQLKFANGFETPMFQTENAKKLEAQSVRI